VFEIREAVTSNPSDLKFQFTSVTNFPGRGSITGSGAVGAGAVFNTSRIPLTIFELERCASVAPHIHPNGAETVFALEGKLKVYQFRGEEAGTNVSVVEISKGEAAYIQQGAIHFVENSGDSKASFLQLFDHVQAGVVFVAPALVNLPMDVVNSAFSEDIIKAGTKALSDPSPALIRVRGCKY
jgi:quercetin dioxygenase-like cupin family protein